MRAVAIIQARTGSTRFPGKVLMPLAGQAFILRVIEAVQAAQLVQDVLLAVPERDLAVLSPLAHQAGCKIFAGSEEDVLGRYALAARATDCDTIVRATGDNPFVCPQHIDSILLHHAQTGADLSHWLGIPLGSGVEVIRREVLLEADRVASQKHEREHVTPWIYAQRSRYFILEPNLDKDPGIRLTVDTAEDYARAVRILDFFYAQGIWPVRLEQILLAYHDHKELFI
jgi:spore coat polysaccharide biosynthesis protein SpsF